MAIKLGRHTRLWLAVFYTATVTGILTAGWLVEMRWIFYANMIVVAAQFTWQVIKVDFDSTEDCLEKFRSNHWLGGLVFVSIISGF